MPVIITLVVLALTIALVAMFVREARQHRGAGPSATTLSLPRADPAPPPRRAAPRETARETVDVTAVDTEHLAAHVRGLRRAVDDGLLPRAEAVESIVRQAGGGIGNDAAERLLDRAVEATGEQDPASDDPPSA